MATVPVIDISTVNVSKPVSHLEDSSLRLVGHEIISALTEIGFFHVVNHGVPENIIEEAKKKSREFFDSPIDKKLQCLRRYPSIMGYLPLPNVEIDTPLEVLDKNKPPDLNETLHYAEWFDYDKTPESFINGFRKAIDGLCQYEHELYRRLMLLIGYGLDLDNPRVLLDGLQHLGTRDNETMIRFANYPPISELKENQQRCGVHTDFGTLTFILQDSVPGLEIKTRAGNFLPVQQEVGGVLVNAADLLQRWTGNVIRSAHHKVVVDKNTCKHGRTSLIYFGNTDVDYGISAVTGDQSGKFREPVNAKEFRKMRYVDIYEKGKGLIDED